MTRILIHGGRVLDPAVDFDGPADVLIDEGLIAGVEPGGDIGRANMRHERLVVGVSDTPPTEGFTHIAIDIDDTFQNAHPRLFVTKNAKRENRI